MLMAPVVAEEGRVAVEVVVVIVVTAVGEVDMVPSQLTQNGPRIESQEIPTSFLRM